MAAHYSLPDNLKRIRILAKIATLTPVEKTAVWRLYRFFRKSVKNMALISDYATVCATVMLDVKTGPAYRCYALALNLAQSYSRMKLRSAGLSTRVLRPLVIEAFHLLRIQLQIWFGMRQPSLLSHVTFGSISSVTPMLAYCDGSFSHNTGGAGVLILDLQLEPLVEISRAVPVQSAFLAELSAMTMALQTLLALDMRHAILHVDAQGLLTTLTGSSEPRYGHERAQILELVQAFAFLQIILVPRLFNFRADRLAAN
ncbi:MAG: ribonuclease H family protein [Agitococcus sp.]|nr:ribonuclease H family protein [Agitococcus sp.]MDO9177056.1 ribonuclease H family protein [Agitococcus sp.]